MSTRDIIDPNLDEELGDNYLNQSNLQNNLDVQDGG